eukprot:14166235-Alexandrium_andersonii.AAC.1
MREHRMGRAWPWQLQKNACPNATAPRTTVAFFAGDAPTAGRGDGWRLAASGYDYEDSTTSLISL